MSMQSQARTNQGGSVVNFLVVGLVLAAIAISAIYFVQQRTQNTQNPTPTPTPTPSASKSPQVQQENGSREKPKASPSPSRTPSATKEQSDLPETGPSDDLISVIASASLIGMIVAYVRSLQYRSRAVPELD